MSDPPQLSGVDVEPATVLLVEARECARSELHNAFESAGYNLIEAGDAEEAMAVGEMHEGALHLVIARAAQAGEISKHLRGFHPALQALCVVENAPRGSAEIRLLFTEQELLTKVSMLLTHKALI